MSWLASVGVGFLTAIVTAFGGIGIGVLCVEWYRIPSREGGSGYFVIFLGLIGLVLGLVIGVVCARIVAAGAAPGFLKGLGVAAGSCVGLLMIVTLICWLAADLDTTLHGNPVELQAEVRCPPGFVVPPGVKDDAWYAHIDTRTRRVTSRGALRVDEARQENGHWIIPMTLVLGTSVREKLLYVRFGDDNVQLFIPRFPSKPGAKYLVWSNWQDGGWETGKPRPEPAQRFKLRFRVAEVIPEPEPAVPSGPTADEIEAERKAKEDAVLAALNPDSPLEDCLKFTHYTQTEERRQKAGAVIGQRRDVVAEISAQIISPDREISDRALRAMAFITPLPAELAAPVAAMGEKVVASIKHFNASQPEDDPRYQGAADASVLFSSWFQGHRALHEHAGVDGLPQLKRILELAVQREDSYVMKNDVARIARHYVKEWNVAPNAAR
jgi:hypothetical protein